MPYNLELAEDEQVIANLTFVPGSNSHPVSLAITNRAVYLPRTKVFAKVDPTYFERVSISEVLEVRIRKLHATWMIILSVAMVVTGVALTAIMIWPFMHGQQGTVSGYPPAIAVCGAVIPFLLRNRYGLDVKCVRKGFKWNPPLLLDKQSRNRTQDFYDTVLEACRETGVPTFDERSEQVESPQTAKGRHPPAALPEDEASGVVCPCTTCGELLRMSRWDRWNNFLVECPHCGYPHGRHWSLFWFVLAALFLNLLSFFLVMRPKKALLWALGWAAYWAIIQADKGWDFSKALPFGLYVLAMTGPAAVVALLVIRHEAALSKATLWLGEE